MVKQALKFGLTLTFTLVVTLGVHYLFLTKNNLFEICVICGSNHVGMHYIRKVRDLKSKARGKTIDFLTMQMAAINRKQAPLCPHHHKALHNNILSTVERELFKSNLRLLKKSA